MVLVLSPIAMSDNINLAQADEKEGIRHWLDAELST